MKWLSRIDLWFLHQLDALVLYVWDHWEIPKSTLSRMSAVMFIALQFINVSADHKHKWIGYASVLLLMLIVTFYEVFIAIMPIMARNMSVLTMRTGGFGVFCRVWRYYIVITGMIDFVWRMYDHRYVSAAGGIFNLSFALLVYVLWPSKPPNKPKKKEQVSLVLQPARF